MEPISYSKAKQALKKIRHVDQEIVAPGAEGRFLTVKDRLDWIEDQASKIKATNTIDIDLSQGTFHNTEYVDGKIRLKLLASK